jgi:hypothetical protein
LAEEAERLVFFFRRGERRKEERGRMNPKG